MPLLDIYPGGSEVKCRDSSAGGLCPSVDKREGAKEGLTLHYRGL